MNFRALPARTALGAFLAISLALLAPDVSLAQGAAAPKKVVSIEGITEYQLDNGLRVLLFPDDSTPTVTVNLTMLVGSRHEGYGETGMAHLLEHMVFKGTPTHPDVPKALKEHGAQFNGTTWVDRTNYFETMPATDENLEFGIKLEADRMVNSFVRREDLVSEMTVVRNEFEMGENNPNYILSQRMMAAAFQWHNYGKSTIGNRSDIERVPIDRLQVFYKKFYQPDNAVLVVAGKFEEKKALEYIGKYFGTLKRPERKLETTYTEEPAQDGEKTVTLRRVGKVGVVGVLYHIPPGSHDDFAAVEVLNSILVSEPSGRLYQALVPVNKATSVSGVAYGWHDPGVLEFSAEVDPKSSLEAVRDTMIGLLEKLPSQEFKTEEVERAKDRFKRDRDLLMSKSARVAITLSDWAAKGDWRLFFLHRDRVAKVTATDVKQVAANYLRPTNRTVGIYIPGTQSERSAIPPTPNVAAMVKDYKGGEAVAAGEVFDPTPENIEKRVKRSQSKEAPEAKLALLPKKSRGEAVVLQLTLRYGNEKSLQGQNVACQMLGALMIRGTDQHDRQQLQDELAKLGARLSASSDVGSVTFNLETNRKNLKPAVALLVEMLRKPVFPEKEFAIMKRENLERLKKGLVEPTALSFRALSRQLSPYSKDDVRYVPTYEEDIARWEAATLQQVKDLYTKQVGGQASVLVVVGDFNTNPEDSANRPDLELWSLLRNWKSGVEHQRIARPAKTDIAGSKDVILTPDKANAMYVSGHMLAMTDNDPDYPALEVANFILGGGTLSSRLGNRVRQKEGLSYGVRSTFGADAKDKAGRFSMYAICAPENMEKVDKVIAEEIEKFLKDGVTAAELTEAKKSFLEARKVQRSTDASVAHQLGDGLEEDRTFAWHADLEKKIAGLTPDAVNAAIRKHLQPKKLVIVKAGDFKK